MEGTQVDEKQAEIHTAMELQPPFARRALDYPEISVILLY